MKTVQGDVLLTTAYYILQQCNCLTTRAYGLSSAIAKKFPYANVYAKRKKFGNQSIPGTIEICTGTPNIICLYGQWNPGKPSDSYSNTFPDDYINRIEYFKNGLNEVLLYFQTDNIPCQIAVPYKIGCGLAGGDWKEYYKILVDFDKKLQEENLGEIIIYKL